MTRLEDRQILVRDIEQARAEGARLAPACALVGIDAGTLRRWKAGDGLRQGDRRPDADRPVPSHALSEAERAGSSRSPMNRASPRRRRRGLSRHWPSRVSTLPVSPASIACCARMVR